MGVIAKFSKPLRMCDLSLISPEVNFPTIIKTKVYTSLVSYLNPFLLRVMFAGPYVRYLGNARYGPGPKACPEWLIKSKPQ